jgi:nucleoid-associated protein YgaU
MGLRYGLLAVLTLIIASALVWDRLHPPEVNHLFPRDEPAKEDLAVVVLGGKPETLAAPPPPASSMPGGPSGPGGNPAGVLAADDAGSAPSGVTQDGTYTVEKGDTLGQIALKTLGTSRKAGDLARFNGIPVDAPLKVGQELRIPPANPVPPPGAPPQAPSTSQAKVPAPPAPAAPAAPPREGKRTHTVGKGDTLFALARRYYGDGARFRDLAEANGLDPDEPLKVGAELKVP